MFTLETTSKKVNNMTKNINKSENDFNASANNDDDFSLCNEIQGIFLCF